MRCRDLRFLPLSNKDKASSGKEGKADWFLAALFLACNLDSKNTSCLAELVLHYVSMDFTSCTAEATFDTGWPLSTRIDNKSDSPKLDKVWFLISSVRWLH